MGKTVGNVKYTTSILARKSLLAVMAALLVVTLIPIFALGNTLGEEDTSKLDRPAFLLGLVEDADELEGESEGYPDGEPLDEPDSVSEDEDVTDVAAPIDENA